MTTTTAADSAAFRVRIDPRAAIVVLPTPRGDARAPVFLAERTRRALARLKIETLTLL
ncbi:hypothetical protein BH09MYX1_BH09MYX1_11780 [soil metagenome]